MLHSVLLLYKTIVSCPCTIRQAAKIPARPEAAPGSGYLFTFLRLRFARGLAAAAAASASALGLGVGDFRLVWARLLLRGPQGARECSLGELVTAPYRNAPLPGELIEAVRIDKLDCPQRFFKLGRRRALAISRLTVSVSGRLTDGRIDDLRVALGSAFPRPMCFPEITEAVQGERPTPELLRRIAAQTAAKLPEIAGVRASTLYTQPVSQKLLERLLGELFEVQYG